MKSNYYSPLPNLFLIKWSLLCKLREKPSHLPGWCIYFSLFSSLKGCWAWEVLTCWHWQCWSMGMLLLVSKVIRKTLQLQFSSSCSAEPFDFTRSWPSNNLMLHSDPPQIHSSAVRSSPPDKERRRRGAANLHWTDPGWLGICQKPAAGTSNYIGHESAYLETNRKKVFNPRGVGPRAVSANKHRHEKDLIFGFFFQIVHHSAWSLCGLMTVRSRRHPTSGPVWVLTGEGWISRSVWIYTETMVLAEIWKSDVEWLKSWKN